MGKRCICIALALILLTTIGLAPLAQPANAVAGVVVAGAVVAVMAMAGITIVTSGMTAAQIQDWVEDKLEEWAADVGSPLDHLINSAGIGVTISGLLTIGTAAAQGINQFITWLRQELGLQDNTTANVISSNAAIKAPVFTTYSTDSMLHIMDSPYDGSIYVASSNDSTYLAICGAYITAASLQNFTYYVKTTARTYAYAALYDGTYYVYSYSMRNYGATQNFPVYETTQDYYIDFGNYVNNSGETLDVQTGVITIPQVQNDDKVFVDVGALPGSTVSEVTEGVFTDVAADTLDVSGTVAEEEPEYVITGPVSVSGLDDIFPFCIPFDLYHMLEALAADPVAPHFEWRFYVPRIVDYTIVIDLSGFNTVAQILRVMETLLFCVGLAFETRKLIRS